MREGVCFLFVTGHNRPNTGMGMNQCGGSVGGRVGGGDGGGEGAGGDGDDDDNDNNQMGCVYRSLL